jgi:hypothetical protein
LLDVDAVGGDVAEEDVGVGYVRDGAGGVVVSLYARAVGRV